MPPADSHPPAQDQVASPHALASAAALADVERLMTELAVAQVPGSVLPDIAHGCLRSGGKRMRAGLALRACAALGVDDASARAWAAACELMHNATLVHDDLQDGDTTRRGQPTLWVAHGAAQAINVGDWLFMLAFRALSRLEADVAARHGFALAQALAQGMAEVIEGQGLECSSKDYLHRVSEFPYEAMVRGKTAALFTLPVWGAALLAGHAALEARALTAPFAELGVLFQQQDDVLDLWGDKGRGLSGADLYEGKLSAVVVTHLRRTPEDAAWLAPLLAAAREDTPAADVARAIARFAESGTRQALLAEMEARGAKAHAASAGPLAKVMVALLAGTWAPIATLREASASASAARPAPPASTRPS